MEELAAFYIEQDFRAGAICYTCVREPHLQSEVVRWGTPRTCSFCKAKRPHCVGLATFADRIDVVYRRMIGIADDSIAPDGFRVEGGMPAWQAMCQLTGCSVEVSDAVLGCLRAREAKATSHRGTIDWYDEEREEYVLRYRNVTDAHDTWGSFCRSTKHESRFFSREAAAMLDGILGPLITSPRPLFGPAVRTIGPDSDDRFIYRGRIANDEAARIAIYSSPISQLGPPPRQLAAPGRMNPAGIRMFYGSWDAKTCVAELRASVGGHVIVGAFEIIRPLRLLDLVALESLENDLSEFDPLYEMVDGIVSFVPAFHAEVRKPVIPGSEALEYVPTQVVAEYLYSHPTHAVDGMIFKSSQAGGDCRNIVLFPSACGLEGADVEETRLVADVTSVEAADGQAAVEQVQLAHAKGSRRGGVSGSSGRGAHIPSLRLHAARLSRFAVNGIAYDVSEARVDIRDQYEVGSFYSMFGRSNSNDDH